jgi:hypothetical protein
MSEPKTFDPPKFTCEKAKAAYFERFGRLTIEPEDCLICATCGEYIYPGEKIADGPVHRTFECCPPGMGGWSTHYPTPLRSDEKQ